MSRIRQTMKWFREMSVLAEGEQRAAGHPDIDVEHLFLALLSVGGPVTDALASERISLERARNVFADIHSRRIEALGIRLPTADEGGRRLPDDAGRGEFRYRPGVRRMLEDASAHARPDAALFATLVAEPSGHVREALRELVVEPDAIMASIQVGSAAEPATEPFEYRRFVPAALEEVWALVSNPSRWLEWNNFDFERAEVAGVGEIRAYVGERGAHRRTSRVKPAFRVATFSVTRCEPRRLIQWDGSYPQGGRPGPRLRIGLRSQGSGTELTLALIPTRDAGPGGPLRWAARAMRSPLARAHLRGRADNLSNALRH